MTRYRLSEWSGAVCAYMLQRDEDSALRVLKDATKRWPQDAEAWNATGVMQIRRKALDAAIDAFTHATTVARDESLGYFNLARAYQMRAAQEQRYDRVRERWFGGETDTKKAAAGYQEYIRLGGPYLDQASQALLALNSK